MKFVSRTIMHLTVLAMLCMTSVVSAEDVKSADEVVTDFVAHIDSLDSLDDAAKKEIKAMVEELRADEYSQMEAVTAGLTKIYPEYEKALISTQGTDLSAAVTQLTPYLESEDKFLAADASFFLARTLMTEQRFEEALPMLDNLAGDLNGYSLHAGPAVYFSGVAQASLLENQRAITSFNEFLNNYESAPERLRVAAFRQIQAIRGIEEGGMTDVLQRMDYSRRRLEIENTNDDTQEQQDKIVGMLGKLIKDQEKKECSSCNSKKNCENQGDQEAKGKGKGEGEGQGKSNAGGTSNNPNGVVKRTYDDGPASPWSQLRDRTRDAANNAVKEKLPARYKPVVEEYYGKTSGNEEDK